ncbi:hypothetical protein J4204_00620 [Candidatus Woesearchaeota archaeon]|nr:hypothetical protein [Candidatus Woesearchaeota archaeon]
MNAKTLSDRIAKDFSVIKLKKAVIKVPKLKAVKPKAKPKKLDEMPVSSVINILIKSAVEKAKKEKREKAALQDDRNYIILKDDKIKSIGGYGAVSKSYGASPHSSYVDYGKIFSYLGKFRAQSAFENFDGSHVERLNRIMEQGNKSYLIDKETMDSGVKNIKYFINGPLAAGPGSVPLGGMSSAEWEKFKMWMIVDYVMFSLKMSTL